MINDKKICMVVPCYKRPELAERLIDSVVKFNIKVDNILVLLMPEDQELNNKYPELVEVKKHKQANCARARNIAVNYAIDKYNPDLIWLTDDDVYYDNGVDNIVNEIKAFDIAGLGIMAITRRMGSYKPQPEPSFQNFVYIGGGNIFTPSMFKIIEGYDNDDGADELLFSLKAYLAGYQNVRIRSCSAIHEQGKSSTGGIYGLVHENSGEIDINKDTKLLNPNFLIQVESNKLKYGNRVAYDTGVVNTSKLTPLARTIHNVNRKKLLNGTLKTEDVPFTSLYKGQIWK